MNKNGANIHIPLKGLAIGDGLCDPIHQMAYGDFLFQVGLVDENDRDLLQNMTQTTKEYIKSGLWEKATDVSLLFYNFSTVTGYYEGSFMHGALPINYRYKLILVFTDV